MGGTFLGTLQAKQTTRHLIDEDDDKTAKLSPNFLENEREILINPISSQAKAAELGKTYIFALLGAFFIRHRV